MRLGQLLRVTNPGHSRKLLDSDKDLPDEVDGFRNFYAETLTSKDGRATLTILTSGINKLSEVKNDGVSVVPAVCIRSTPHRAGTESTPWQDRFDLDVGHVSYAGDNKPEKGLAEEAQGNKALLAQFDLHRSPDRFKRLEAAPLLFFVARRSGTGISGSVVEFAGVGVIEAAERVVQWDAARDRSFVNYVFDVVILDLSAEDEHFDWDWVRSRRSPEIDLEDSLAMAPANWKRWVRDGPSSLESVRRRVSRLQVTPTREQKPTAGSRHESILRAVYAYYKGSEAVFEGVADRVVERIIADSGASYRSGWITPGGGDQGIDFIGRSSFHRTRWFGPCWPRSSPITNCSSGARPSSDRHVRLIAASQRSERCLRVEASRPAKIRIEDLRLEARS